MVLAGGPAQHICLIPAGQIRVLDSAGISFWEGESEGSPFQIDLWAGAVKEVPFKSICFCQLVWKSQLAGFGNTFLRSPVFVSIAFKPIPIPNGSITF